MGAVEYLERIKKIDAIIANKMEDKARWFEIAKGMGGFSASDGVQSSKNPQKMSDAVIRYTEIEREIKALEAEKDSMMKTLEKLSCHDYGVLVLFYLRGYSHKQIAKHFDRSYDWSKKRKSMALDMLQNILNERKE